MKQEKLCESEDMTMEELGMENSRVDEVRERINMMQISREAAMQTDPTKVIFPPNITPENRLKAMETMRLAMEAEKKRQPMIHTTGYVNTTFAPSQFLVDADVYKTPIPATPPATKANDRQVGGSHYKNAGVEPWDVIDTWPKEQQIGAYRSGALKYIMRAGDKDPFKQDIAKAHHYLEKLLEILE
jgi:hypothetical protein